MQAQLGLAKNPTSLAAPVDTLLGMSGLAKGELVTFAREQLLERIADARESVWLVSPFLTRSVSERIRDAVEQSSARERRLLTALSDRSVQVGVLDARALSVLHEGDFRLASIRNLHAKVTIVEVSGGWSALETSPARAWEANRAAT